MPSSEPTIGQKDVPSGILKTEITGLAPGTLYYCHLYNVDAGEDSFPSTVSGTTRPAVSLPASPTDLTAVPTSNTMALKWAGPPNASGYIIDYGIAPNGAATRTTSVTTQCSISGLSANTRYYFDVCSSNSNGNSAPARVLKDTLQVPATPADLRATPAILSMELTWTLSSGAAHYVIRYGTEPGAGSQTRTTTLPRYTLTDLAKNTLYFIEVTATNDNGESLPARITKATLDGPSLPPRPGALHLLTTWATVSVSWSVPGSPEYKVSYGLDDDDRRVIAVETTSYLNHVLRALLPETRYFVEVRGSNISGESPPSIGTATTKAFEAPRSLAVSEVTDESAALRWSAGADYSRDIRYEVYLGDHPIATVDDTHHVVKGLTEDTRYLAKVRAIRSDGIASGHAQTGFTTLAYRGDRICAPGNLTGTRNSATTALLSWDEPYATCPLCPNAVGYEVSVEGVQTVEVSRPPYEVKGLDPLQEYYLSVRAKGGGNNVSAPSRARIGRRPGAPRAVAVSAITSSCARVTWHAPVENVPLFDYVIYCSGKLIAATPALEFTVKGLTAATDYTIEVHARTAASTQSDPARIWFSTKAEEDVTPPGQPGTPSVSHLP